MTTPVYEPKLLERAEQAARQNDMTRVEIGLLLNRMDVAGRVQRAAGDNVFQVDGQTGRFLDLLEELPGRLTGKVPANLVVRIYVEYSLPPTLTTQNEVTP